MKDFAKHHRAPVNVGTAEYNAPLKKNRFGVSLPILVAFVAFAAALGAGPHYVLSDPDTYMHIAVGRWIVAHHAVPHVGIFSGTMPNAPWVAHEWLAETILALCYAAGGWNGVMLATALSFALALGIMTRVLLRILPPVYALFGTLTAWGMTLPHLLARPHIFTFPIIVVWFAALIQARDDDRAPPLWLLPVMTLWANLHGSYMFGLVFVGIFAGEAFLVAKTRSARLTVVRQWGFFGLLATGACIITPFGIYTLWLPFHVMDMKFALSSIGEWVSPNFQKFQVLEIWMLLAFALALSYGVRLPLTRIAMLLLLLHMSLVHQRNIDLLGLIAPLLVARPLSFQLTVDGSHHDRIARMLAELAGRANAFGRSLTAVIFIVASAAYLSYPIVRSADANTPVAALQAAREHHLTSGRVFNAYRFGGYLIFSGIAPFIDGRAELYGDGFIRRYVEASTGNTNGLGNLLNQYHITWSLLATKSPGVTLMAHMSGWKRIYTDPIATVFARSGPVS